jgi:hypothetical protein
MYQNMADRFDPEVVVIGFFVGNDFTGDLNLVLGDRLLYAEDGGVKGVRSPIEDGTLWMDPFNTPVKFEDARQRVVPEEVWRGGWRSILRKTILSPICYRLQAEAVRAAGGMTEAELTNPPQNPAGLSCQSLSGELTEPCESYPLRNESLVRNNSDAIYKEVYTDLDREDMAYALESLRNLTARIEADGRQAVILIIPEAHQIPNQGLGYKWLRGLYPDEIIDSRSPQDLLLEFCMQMGLSCIDLLPVFLEHQDQPLYWPNESHWTPLGHRLAAETLIKHLELPH